LAQCANGHEFFAERIEVKRLVLLQDRLKRWHKCLFLLEGIQKRALCCVNRDDHDRS